MATIVTNEKGFKVLEVSRAEMLGVFGMSICDYCGNPLPPGDNKEVKGFMICVLNRFYCPECYEHFKKVATNYPEDRAIEERNFEGYKHIFRV